MVYISRLTSNFTNIIMTAVSRYYDNEIQNVAYDTCNISIKGIYGKHSNTLYTPAFHLISPFRVSRRKISQFLRENVTQSPLFAWRRSFFLSHSRKLIYYGCYCFVQRRGDGINHHKNMVDGNELWKDNSNLVSAKSSRKKRYDIYYVFSPSICLTKTRKQRSAKRMRWKNLLEAKREKTSQL